MKHTIMAVLLVMICLCSCMHGRNENGDCIRLYVDARNGCDTNTGTKEKPFQTILTAQQKVREKIAAGLKANIEIVLSEGKYMLEQPLRFDQRDSVPDGFTVTYKSAPGVMAEIIGGKAVTNWEEVSDGIFKAKLPAGWSPSKIMENGITAVKARTPNEGYATVGPNVQKLEGGRCKLDLGDGIDAAHFNPKDAQVVVWSGQHKDFDDGKNYDWFCSLIGVVDADFEEKTIVLEENGHFPIYPRNRYYLRGAKEFIDRPGEFTFDSSKNVLYYKPRKLPIDEQEIIAATVPHTIWIEGTLEKPVQNIRFKNLRVSLSQELPRCYYASMFLNDGANKREACFGMVHLEHAKNIVMDGCHFRHAGMSAVAMFRQNLGHRITDCLIEDNGSCGICTWGYGFNAKPFKDEVQAYKNRDHVFVNNLIRRCGQLIAHSAGIELHQAGDIEIANNLFEDLPRYGVTAFTQTYMHMINPKGTYKGEIYGKKVTWENHHDFIFCRNINVHHNEVRRAMGDSQDGGGINFYGMGLGNKIENNFVHNCKSKVTDGQVMGIYADDNSNYIEIRNNIVSRIGPNKYICPMVVKGVGNVVENNILADSLANWGVFYVLQTPMGEFVDWAEGQGEERTDNLEFRRNIVYRCGESPIYSIYPFSENIIKESDYNLYYLPDGKYEVKIDWQPKSWEFWTSVFDGRYEQHSIKGEDPMFVDPDNMDYRLKPGSPAYKIGFKDIEMRTIGLRDDFPFPNK